MRGHWNRISRDSLRQSTAALGIILIGLAPRPSYGNTTQPPQQPPSQVEVTEPMTGDLWQDYDRVCQNVPSRERVEAMRRLDPNVNINPRWEQCDAAKSAITARDKSMALMATWIGVASVCTAMCVIGFTGNGVPIICQGVNMAASVVDAAVTEEFTGLLMGLGSTVLGLSTSMNGPGGLLGALDSGGNGGQQQGNTTQGQGQGQGGTTAEGAGTQASAGGASDAGGSQPTSGSGESQTQTTQADAGGSDQQQQQQGTQDTGACLAAVTAAATAVQKGMTMDSSAKTGRSSIDAAAQLANTGGDHLAKNGPDSFSLADHSARRNTSVGGREMGNVTSVSGSTDSEANADCRGAASGGSHDAIVSCALASDSSLPRGVGNPAFRSDLQQRLGRDLAGIAQASNSNPPGDVLASAMSAGLGGKAGSTISGIVSEMGSRMPSSAGSYAGGGRGGRGGGAADPFGGAIAGLMDQLLGKKGPAGKEADPHAGVKKVAEAVKARGPASVSEDRNLGIFDRISYRYYALAYQGFGSGDLSVPQRGVTREQIRAVIHGPGGQASGRRSVR
jgi:hypothetical protein